MKKIDETRYTYNWYNPVKAADLVDFIKEHNLQNLYVTHDDGAICFHTGLSDDGCLYGDAIKMCICLENEDDEIYE